MSENLWNADQLSQLLDNGWTVSLYLNELGSYTAVAMKPGETMEDVLEDEFPESQITDDWTPAKVMSRLIEKVIHGRIK